MKELSDYYKNETPAVDTFLLLLASIIGVCVCLTGVGLIPAGILLYGLAFSLKTGNGAHLSITAKIVSTFGWVVVTCLLVAALPVTLLAAYQWDYEPREYLGIALGMLVASLFVYAGILALKYLWLQPLLRNFLSIRSFLLSKHSSPPAKKQAIVAREALQPYSVADEIAKWKALHDDGAITAEEYADARRRLLAS